MRAAGPTAWEAGLHDLMKVRERVAELQTLRVSGMHDLKDRMLRW
jgi:hypothetical protein